MLEEEDMKLIEQAKHFIEYAKFSKEDELDNVVKVFVNFIREQRIEILEKALQSLNNQEIYEAIISERKRQETSEPSEGKTL